MKGIVAIPILRHVSYATLDNGRGQTTTFHLLFSLRRIDGSLIDTSNRQRRQLPCCCCCCESGIIGDERKGVVAAMATRNSSVRTGSIARVGLRTFTHPSRVRRCSDRGSPRSGYADAAAISSGTPVCPWASARALPVRLRCPAAFGDRLDPPSPIICRGNRSCVTTNRTVQEYFMAYAEFDRTESDRPSGVSRI